MSPEVDKVNEDAWCAGGLSWITTLTLFNSVQLKAARDAIRRVFAEAPVLRWPTLLLDGPSYLVLALGTPLVSFNCSPVTASSCTTARVFGHKHIGAALDRNATKHGGWSLRFYTSFPPRGLWARLKQFLNEARSSRACHPRCFSNGDTAIARAGSGAQGIPLSVRAIAGTSVPISGARKKSPVFPIRERSRSSNAFSCRSIPPVIGATTTRRLDSVFSCRRLIGCTWIDNCWLSRSKSRDIRPPTSLSRRPVTV